MFNQKLDTIVDARHSWPQYVTYEEDISWELRYTDERVVMWDNTTIPSEKFGNAGIYAATFL